MMIKINKLLLSKFTFTAQFMQLSKTIRAKIKKIFGMEQFSEKR